MGPTHHLNPGPSESRELVNHPGLGVSDSRVESRNLYVQQRFWRGYLFLAVLGLGWWEQTFSRGGTGASHRRGFSYGAQATVVVVHRLQSTGSVAVVQGLSRPAACGIFLDQGSKDQTGVPCTARQILNPWTTREVLIQQDSDGDDQRSIVGEVIRYTIL